MLKIQKVLRILILSVVLIVFMLISTNSRGSLFLEKLHIDAVKLFNTEKESELTSVDYLTIENLKLQNQLEKSDLVSEAGQLQVTKLIKASVVSNVNNPWLSRYRVDKGTDAGVTVGQIAIENGSLIGVVTEVTPISAVITSIFDSRFSTIAKFDNSEVLIHYDSSAQLIAESRSSLSIASDAMVKTVENELVPANIKIAKVSKSENSSSSNSYLLDPINSNKHPSSVVIVRK